MKSQDKKILDFVNRVVMRIRWRNTLKLGICSVLAAIIGGIALSLASRFIPIIELPFMLLIMGVIVTVVGLVIGFIYPVDKNTAILEADSHGLEERVITAYGLLKDETSMGLIQKNDAVAHIDGFELKKIGVKPEKKMMIAAAVLAAVMLVTLFLPNPLEEKIKDLTAMNKAKKAAVKIIKQEEKKIDKNNKLSEQDRAKLKKELSEFRKLIKEAKNKTDMAKAAMQLEKKLQLMGKKDSEKRLKDIAAALGNKSSTQKIAEAIKAGDPEKVKKLLEQLSKALANKDKAALKKLADELAKAAEELKGDKKTSDALEKLAKDIKDGKLSDAEGQLAELSDTLSQMVSAEEMEGAMGELAGAIRKASPIELAENGSLSKAQGQMPGSGTGNGSGNGNGNGNGSGGVGNGSNPGTENQKPSDYKNGIGHRANVGTGKVSDFDKVWTSKTVGGVGEKSELKGKPGSGGTTAQAETEKGISTAGTIMSYDKVIGEYTREAVEGLSSKELPPALEKLVKDYFTGLNE